MVVLFGSPVNRKHVKDNHTQLHSFRIVWVCHNLNLTLVESEKWNKASWKNLYSVFNHWAWLVIWLFYPKCRKVLTFQTRPFLPGFCIWNGSGKVIHSVTECAKIYVDMTLLLSHTSLSFSHFLPTFKVLTNEVWLYI